MTKQMMYLMISSMALTTSAISRADSVGAGAVSSAHNFVPTITSTGNTGTYAAISGATFQTSASDAFSKATFGTGTLNGTLTFSEIQGTTMIESDPGFFTFSDGLSGNYVFDVTSILTRSFLANVADTSGALYLLGSVYDSSLNLTASLAALTLTFNSTGGSAYSSSATLSSPPLSVTPEPSSLLLLATGIVGTATTLIRRRHAVCS